MEHFFEFLFKYRPFFFRKGELVFQWGLPFWLVLLLILTLLGSLFWLYRRYWGQWRTSPAIAVFVLRSALLALLLGLLMRPTLVLSTLVPKENLLAILVDNSLSMGIPENNRARGEPVRKLLSGDSPFISRLDQKFALRFYQFDSRAEREEEGLKLNWDGQQTNIASALETVLADTRNLPLGGIVLFSDGSDNSFRDFREVVAALKARMVPVHTVGVGPESFQKDAEIRQVSAPRTVLPETSAVVRVTIHQNGFGGARGRLEVREGTLLVDSKEIHFPRDSQSFTTEVTLTPKAEGVKTYTFTLRPLQGEQLTRNNTRQTILEVENRPARILYVEGHPRWDYKFIRQAVARDKSIHLVTLLRTAMNKFYRQGIEEEHTLASGFPSRREDLFSYQGLIFGSVESAFFTYPQMELVRDFVGQRGGGFLMIGGRSSFSSGNYQNTPIEEILPVWLEQKPASGAAQDDYRQGDATFTPTIRGLQHPALNVFGKSADEAKAWAEMPPLKDWNLVGGRKPGAVVLADLAPREKSQGDREYPLLLFERFGRGQTFGLLSGSSWRWQMLRDHKDQSHETFWRQMLRWLVSSASGPVTVETEREIYSQNEPVRIRAEVRDQAFNPVNDAHIQATVTAQDGKVSEIPLHWDAQNEGTYVGTWSTHRDGLFKLQVSARRNRAGGDQSLGHASSFFRTSTGDREYFDAVQKKDFLQKLAQETGGRFYPISGIEHLPEEITYTESHASVVQTLDLWDMPINFLLIVGLLAGEWILRRRHGRI